MVRGPRGVGLLITTPGPSPGSRSFHGSASIALLMWLYVLPSDGDFVLFIFIFQDCRRCLPAYVLNKNVMNRSMTGLSSHSFYMWKERERERS